MRPSLLASFAALALATAALPLKASAAEEVLDGRKFIRVSAEFADNPNKLHYCLKDECGKETKFYKGEALARLYDVECDATDKNKCKATPLAYQLQWFEVEPAWVPDSVRKGIRDYAPEWLSGYLLWKLNPYAFADSDAERKNPIPTSYSLYDDKLSMSQRFTLTRRPASELVVPTTTEPLAAPVKATCEGKLSELCPMAATAPEYKTCVTGKKDEILALFPQQEEKDACAAKIRGILEATPVVDVPTATAGASQAADVQLGIKRLFKNPVEIATVEFLIDKEGACDKPESVCFKMKDFAAKCEPQPTGVMKEGTECTTAYNTALAVGNTIKAEWTKLIQAAPPTADLGGDQWLKDLAASQPLADAIVKKLSGPITQENLKAFIKDNFCQTYQPAATRDVAEAPLLRSAKFVQAQNVVNQYAADTPRSGVFAAAAPTDALGRFCVGTPGPQVYTRPPNLTAHPEIPGPQGQLQGGPPAKAPGSGGFGEIAALSLGAAAGAVLGLAVLGIGFGFPFLIAGLIGAAVGVGIFMIMRHPPWK